MDTVESIPMLQAHALGKQVTSAHGALQILRDVTLTVWAGESLAVVGASGSGKSTLLALMAGLDQASSGSMRLCGNELTTLDEDARAALRARLVGFVFQSFHLLPAMTAWENVMLPLELAGVAQARQLAHDALGAVGLRHRLDHYPRTLSGGEQQRVAMARAFAGSPRILFADEPTGNLDNATGRQIADLLFKLNQERGTTLVLVTHDEKLAARCARQVRLADGVIVQAAATGGSQALQR